LGVVFNHVDIVEADRIHEKLRTTFVAAGLIGGELDNAIAAAFGPAIESIEANRETKKAAKAKLRLVED
jgi:hypothetical protein